MKGDHNGKGFKEYPSGEIHQNDHRQADIKCRLSSAFASSPRDFLRGNKVVGSMQQATIERFREKIAVAGPDDCWPWRGTRNRGYGRFSVEPYRQTYAHRLVFELTRGRIPAGHVVQHTCGVLSCCNPAHLTIDSHARGETNGRAKLSEEAVKYIRQQRKAGVTAKVLAEKFDLSLEGVYYVASEGWRHVR